MTPQEEALEALIMMLPDAVKAYRACLRPGGGGRHAQTNFNAARDIFDRVGLPAVSRTEISGPNGKAQERKIIVEIVRPLAIVDGEDSRQTRIPARVIDAE